MALEHAFTYEQIADDAVKIRALASDASAAPLLLKLQTNSGCPRTLSPSMLDPYVSNFSEKLACTVMKWYHESL